MQLIFLRKSDCLGCAVLLCLVCLTLLASFFLPSHLSLIEIAHIIRQQPLLNINVYILVYMCTY